WIPVFSLASLGYQILWHSHRCRECRELDCVQKRGQLRIDESGVSVDLPNAIAECVSVENQCMNPREPSIGARHHLSGISIRLGVPKQFPHHFKGDSLKSDVQTLRLRL